MNIELSILNLISNKKGFNKYSKFIKPSLVTKELYLIYTDLKEYYKTHDDINWKSFATWFKLVRHSHFDSDVLAIYDKMFTKLDTYKPKKKDMEIIHALIQRDYSTRLSAYTTDLADGRPGDLSKVVDIMREYHDEIGKAATVKDLFVTHDIDEIMDAVTKKNGMEWRLKELNLMLGPLAPGDFITVAARPGSGKTTMIASELTYLIPQLPEGKMAFVFCNEEDAKRLVARCYQAYFGVRDLEIDKDRKRYHKIYETDIGKHLEFIFDKELHVNQVLEVLHEYKDRVGLVVIDQLHNMIGFENIEEGHARYAGMFRWARELSRIAPVLNCHQLKGEAEGRLYPTMDMMFGSTTMVQGACDAIVMLGKSHDPQYHENVRGLSAPRNKMPGDFKSEGKYRNTQFEIELLPLTARYKGAMK